MTPYEKAISAINTRLERLQANLRDAEAENDQRHLFQSLIVTIAVAEALNDFFRMIRRFAERRHGELKQANESLTAQHAGLLESGKEMLEKLKSVPADLDLRKEIERVQRNMAAIEKTVRRGANALQRDLAPSLAMIDQVSVSVRQFSEADEPGALRRLLRSVVGQTRDFYAAQSSLPAKNIIVAEEWESAALGSVGEVIDYYDAYSRAGHQVLLALELMTMAVSDEPPRTAAEATERANNRVATRLREITSRLTAK